MHSMRFWSRVNLQYDICNDYYKDESINGTQIEIKRLMNESLHVILHKYDFERYNAVFQFLLFLKRTQYQINNAWLYLMQFKRNNKNSDKTNNRSNLLSQMSRYMLTMRKYQFLVNNLILYFQTEVIETEFVILSGKLKIDDNDNIINKNIETVMSGHESFLHSLCRQCFLIGNENLYQLLNKILFSILYYSQCIIHLNKKHNNNKNNNDIIEMNKDILSELNVVSNYFDLIFNNWFDKVKNISLNQQNLHKLQRLLSLLNFNDWFASR